MSELSEILKAFHRGEKTWTETRSLLKVYPYDRPDMAPHDQPMANTVDEVLQAEKDGWLTVQQFHEVEADLMFRDDI
jgi:hypothetical protein